ncbi:MAG: magnesium transporter CorA family protein [Thermohalobaculum sp.]|nr:magnesium transporter CorA family protein [Thermohalobaculum sp.]
MIRIFIPDGGKLRETGAVSAESVGSAIWIDLLTPSRDEETLIETELGLAIPTREEMDEIELSSRLYAEDDALFMTAILPAQSDTDTPVLQPVTFILRGATLVTLRYHDPTPFRIFAQRAERAHLGCVAGDSVLVGLLETVVDRLADILERCGGEIDRISLGVFESTSKPKKEVDLRATLKAIGRQGDLASNIRNSVMTMERLLGFLGAGLPVQKGERDLRPRIKTLMRDLRSLADHSGFLSQKITFLLDATLGLVNIEQNAIIKIFSVAAVVFLPPTLVASIYGMNFAVMPELGWRLGYPFALGLMVLSAVMPFWYFKRRGWL